MQWVIRDLGTLGGSSSRADDINDRGQIIGEADTEAKDEEGDPISHAFLWEDGKLHDLGVPPGATAFKAVAINDNGQVVGTAYMRCPKGSDDYGWSRAFLWQRGAFTDLGALPSVAAYAGRLNASSDAFAINNRGQVIGGSYSQGCSYGGNYSSLTHAFVWQAGRIAELPGASGSDDYGSDIYWPNALNERGQVVGNVSDGIATIPVLWQGQQRAHLDPAANSGADITSEAVDINASGQTIEVDFVSWQASMWQAGKSVMLRAGRTVRIGHTNEDAAVDINDRGQVVRTDGPRAFLWRAGKSTDLGTLPGTNYSVAVAINEHGLAIGYSSSKTDGEGPRSFVWTHGKITELPPLPGGGTSQPSAINERGQVIGLSTTKTGERHAVLWTLRSG